MYGIVVAKTDGSIIRTLPHTVSSKPRLLMLLLQTKGAPMHDATFILQISFVSLRAHLANITEAFPLSFHTRFLQNQSFSCSLLPTWRTPWCNANILLQNSFVLLLVHFHNRSKALLFSLHIQFLENQGFSCSPLPT